MRIFTRRSEWDYSWLEAYPTETRVCRHYEYARYALLRLTNDDRFVFRSNLSIEALLQLLAAKKSLGPVFSLVCSLPAEVKFPLMPWREARKFLSACDPVMLTTMIQEFSNAERPTQETVNFYLRVGAAEKAAEVLAQLEAQPPQPLPRRGAGARNRQEQTHLKYLGATKLLDCPMTAPDAIVLTTETLGRPLLANESEWSRARKRAGKILEPYHAEAAVLRQALA